MKRILKIIGVVILLFVIVTGYQLFHYDNRYLVSSKIYKDYTPTNGYEEQYLVEDYVNERMNAFALLRSGMIASMARYDELVNQGDGIISKIEILFSAFEDHSVYTKFTQKHQYVEQEPMSLEYVGEQYDHNFEYTGVLADGTKVTGNLAIWGSSTAVSTAISFQGDNGQIDEEKASLFTDDSNAEMLAYLMIEAIQDYFGTEYEPNEAALTFFNCSLEDVAGSISYHAATSLASLRIEMGEQTIQKVKTANISTVDEDGFLVNQSY